VVVYSGYDVCIISRFSLLYMSYSGLGVIGIDMHYLCKETTLVFCVDDSLLQHGLDLRRLLEFRTSL
jgi:hypothetical protein